jgi:hypothetical protein
LDEFAGGAGADLIDVDRDGFGDGLGDLHGGWGALGHGGGADAGGGGFVVTG